MSRGRKVCKGGSKLRAPLVRQFHEQLGRVLEAITQAQAEALVILAAAQELPVYVGLGTCWRGWGLAMQGETGLAQLHQGLAAVVAARQAGQVAEGLRLLADALRAFKARGWGDMLAEAYRLQGKLLLCQTIPHTAHAETCFQYALTIARRRQVQPWELRAGMSLSRLWQQQAQGDEARALLAPIHSWFTEGFDTADLQEAKAQLDELS
jgi:hypothetical protein